MDLLTGFKVLIGQWAKVFAEASLGVNQRTGKRVRYRGSGSAETPWL